MRAPAPPIVPALTSVSVLSSSKSNALNLPSPRAGSDGPLKIEIDRLPENGRLWLNGKTIDAPSDISFADFKGLSYDASGLAPGTVSVMSYTVSDPYNQKSRGVVAMEVVGASTAVASVDRGQNAAGVIEGARKFIATLDNFAITPEVGVGPAPIGFAPVPPAVGPDTDVAVSDAPENGALRLGDRVLTRGVRIALADLPKLAFEPKVGSDAQTGTFSIALVADATAGARISVTPELDLVRCRRRRAFRPARRGAGQTSK